MAEEEWKSLYDEKGVLIYEGFTFHGKPCGAGTAYYPDGKKYREGKFGVKGFLSGREYYPNGKLRFEGEYQLNRGYGPNYPRKGFFRTRDGSYTYEGEFKIRLGGVGYPFVEEPKEFGPVVQLVKIPLLMWDDIKTLPSDSGEK